jgi:hypothetical protein
MHSSSFNGPAPVAGSRTREGAIANRTAGPLPFSELHANRDERGVSDGEGGGCSDEGKPLLNKRVSCPGK